ncbi:MAG TPA: DUF3592 domain-containing protein [Flavisolibacter sp.]|jgi:hypothetical protein|nr:DUF3592 domain-containing protein [Flavisolibacter sp.]
MLLTFVTPAIIVLFLYFILKLTLFPLLQIARINRRLSREGVEAQAVLLNMEQTGVYVNNRPQVKLQVQVHPLTGRNFVSEVREVLSLIDLSQLRIGTTLKVKYNPANTKEVMVLRN